MKLLYLIFLFTLASAAKRKGSKPRHWTDQQRVAAACGKASNAFGTWCAPSKNSYKASCFCTNDNSLATVVGCTQLYYHGLDDALIEAISTQCYAKPLEADKIKSALDSYNNNAKNTSEIAGFNKTQTIDYPVLVNPKVVKKYKHSIDIKYNNTNDSLYYGAGLLGYWALVLLSATIVNWGKYLFPSLAEKATNKYTNAFRRYVTSPAVHRSKTNYRRAGKFASMLIPSRTESLIIFFFTALCAATMAPGIVFMKGDPINHDKGTTIASLIAVRTGVLVSCLMPLLILFAGRNNFLQYLTRWEFATFIAYHRWISRLIVIMIIIHSVGYTYVIRAEYSAEMKYTYLRWGVIGTTSGGLILIQGLHWLRTRWYEMFLLIHIILAALFIGGAWIHTDSLGYVYFYYATSAVWVFDRVIRIGRLIAFGCPKAEVFLLADETLRVVVPRPKYWKPVPGGHAFVHFMRPSCFWQSHPFTFTQSTDSSNNIVLYCKVKGGVTHGLYQYLASHPGRTAGIRVSIEGPYGEPSDAKHFNTSVFVAGGNGIPGIYSEAVDLARRTEGRTDRLSKLVWVIGEYKSLFWFYSELIALKKTRISPIIYITKPGSQSCLDEFENRIASVNYDFNLGTVDSGSNGSDQEDEEKKTQIKEKTTGDDLAHSLGSLDEAISIIHSELSHVEFREGRPDINGLVQEQIKDSQGSTAFITCGHPAMVDEIRHCVAENLDVGEGHRVAYFEKLQVWA